MSVRRIYAVCLRQWFLIRDNPVRLIQVFAWVLFDIVLWGFISKYLGGLVQQDIQFGPLFLGAVLIWNFVVRTMHSIANSFFEDVWSRNFLNMFGSPLSVGEYVVGLVLSGILVALVGLVWMIGVAWVLFGFSLVVYGPLIGLLLAILFCTGIALGIFSIAIVLRFGPSAEWFIWPIPEVLSPLVGVFYPIATLPVWLQYVSHLLPPSYVFDAVRSLVLATPVAMYALWGVLLLSIVWIVLACWYFMRVYRMALTTGLIARYSAETAQ